MPRSEAGRDDDELGVERRECIGIRPVDSLEPHADDGEEFLPIGRMPTVRDHRDLCAELGEGVRHREACRVEPEHRDPEPSPFGVPAHEIVESRIHHGMSANHST
jgi:hypothetical protein